MSAAADPPPPPLPEEGGATNHISSAVIQNRMGSDQKLVNDSLEKGSMVFRRFVLNKVLGRGGMGVVWLAHDCKLNRFVALKFLPNPLVGNASAVQALKLETKRCLELSHPGIVRIYDFVEDEGMVAISMEAINGTTVGLMQAQKPFLVFEASELPGMVKQLSEALDYAHYRKHIAHRDLKPANIMLSEDGEVKITDFGISANVSNTMTRIANEQAISGTLSYMSPQQALGHAPSASDDIYSLGATLYRLLTGRPPFYDGDILSQLWHEEPPPPSERRRQFQVQTEPIPEEWDRAISLCLRKDPSQRPRSAGELAGMLGVATQGVEKSAPVIVPMFFNDEQEAPRVTPFLGGWAVALITLVMALVLVVIVFLGKELSFRIWEGEREESFTLQQREQQVKELQSALAERDAVIDQLQSDSEEGIQASTNLRRKLDRYRRDNADLSQRLTQQTETISRQQRRLEQYQRQTGGSGSGNSQVNPDDSDRDQRTPQDMPDISEPMRRAIQNIRRIGR